MSTVQSIQESLKGLSAEELLVIIAAAAAEAKKAVKSAPKKEVKEKKGSMPKGVVPAQLHKPRAWVDFVLAHANENGWPAITVKGQDEPLPASVERDGAYVFESNGKPLNNKQAMSLSKQYWDRKAGVGSEQHLYEMFDANYEPPVQESEEDRAAKAVWDAMKETAKATAKEAEKAAKEAEKAAKEAAKPKAEPKKKAVKAEAPKVAAKEAPKEAPKAVETPKKAAKAVKEEITNAPKKEKKAAKAAKEETPFECADDGQVHKWVFNGKKVFRNFAGEMWARLDTNEVGDWMGKFDGTTLDVTAEEPDCQDD